MGKPRGVSYRKRVEEVNRIYDRYARSGLSNRQIWRRYIWPAYGISERTFYNMMNATAGAESRAVASVTPGLFDFMDDEPHTEERNERY